MLKIRNLFLSAFLVLEIAACGSSPSQEAQAPAPATPAPASTGPADATATPPATSDATGAPTASATPNPPKDLPLPDSLKGKVDVILPTSMEGLEAYKNADFAGAIKKNPGEGQLYEMKALVVRLNTDLTVWRMWDGAEKQNKAGRIGRWWVNDAPHGTQQDFRKAYEICTSWNTLAWVTKCTLKKGELVVVGPGNSVSEETCGVKGESYPASDKDWQVYIANTRERTEAKTLDCSDTGTDYAADPTDISKPFPHPPKAAPAKKK